MKHGDGGKGSDPRKILNREGFDSEYTRLFGLTPLEKRILEEEAAEMAIKKLEDKEIPDKIEIDLSGPDGNAFALMGIAARLYRDIVKDAPEMFAKEPLPYPKTLIEFDEIQNEMMEGDYSHLVRTFDKYFGAFVDLYVPEGLDIYPEDKV